ncbi:MAG: hypothetical protein EHM42_13665, partial [Planctomycetaceae bacterium]
EPIAGSGGFLDLVHAFIAELKRSETWPEDLEQACAARGAGRRDREFARVYAEYQEVLLKHQLFDAEGKFWWAREKLRQGEWGAFGSLDLVVVDGFDDFTQTQYEILGLLASQASRMVVSLPLEPTPVRVELFAKTRVVCEQLAQQATVTPATIDSRSAAFAPGWSGRQLTSNPAEATRPAFQQIARHLFGNTRRLDRAAQAEEVEIVAVAGQRGEVQWLGARIKRLLLEGIASGDIVVAFRDPGEYADLIEQVFPAAGIPVCVDFAAPLAQSPVVRAMLQVLQLELADWEFPAIRAVVDSPFFQPDWPERAGIRTALATLRRLQLGSDRRRILEQIGRDARQAKDPTHRAESAAALALLSRLDQTLAVARQPRSLSSWADVLGALVADLGLLSSRDRWPDDSSHWQTLMSALFAAGRVEQYTGGAARLLDVTEFVRELTDLVQHHSLSANRREAGCVRVLPASEIRNLEIPFLFVAGLSEQSFPRRRADDCLYGELERRQLNEHGLALAHQAVRTQEEMLLFYRVVTRARRRLILSYPAVSPD